MPFKQSNILSLLCNIMKEVNCSTQLKDLEKWIKKQQDFTSQKFSLGWNRSINWESFIETLNHKIS